MHSFSRYDAYIQTLVAYPSLGPATFHSMVFGLSGDKSRPGAEDPPTRSVMRLHPSDQESLSSFLPM